MEKKGVVVAQKKRLLVSRRDRPENRRRVTGRLGRPGADLRPGLLRA